MSSTTLRTATSPAISSQLRSRTRDDHLASEAAVDFASLRTPAALAAFLQGWATVWQAVRRAAHAPSACAAGRQELLAPATEALNWLGTDLTDLATFPGGDDPRAVVDFSRSVRPDARMAGEAVDVRFAELLAAPSSSWGMAYVLRGSRLGGSVLAPLVSDSTGLPVGTGTAFLRSAGTDPGREWVAFRRRLDVLDFSSEETDVAVDAARWTFARVGVELSGRHQRNGLSR